MRISDRKLLETALSHLSAFEGDVTARLSRLEESMRLLRQDLIGDGQPGRIPRLEGDFGQLRADYQRQKGLLAGIRFAISSAITLLSRFFGR